MSTPKAQHTPGPWKTNTPTKANNFGDLVAWVRGRDAVGPVTVAKVFTGNGADNTAEVCAANARLIAAAPELYEALRDVLPLAEAFLRSAPSHPDNAKLESARAVLAKLSSDSERR